MTDGGKISPGRLRGWGRLLADGDGELRLAGLGGVEEGVAGALAIDGFEIQSVLEAVGEAGEPGFAVDIGADFEIKFVGAEESVGNVDFDFGVVNGLGIGIRDGEVGGAVAEAG